MTEKTYAFLTKKTRKVYEAIIHACGESSYCSWTDRQLQLYLFTYTPLSFPLQIMEKRGVIYRQRWGKLRHIIPKIYNNKYVDEFLIPSFGERSTKKMLYFKNFCARYIDCSYKKPSRGRE